MILVLKHVLDEGPGYIETYLRREGFDMSTVELCKGEPLPYPFDFEAVVVMGGPMNVYEEDRYPFLKEEDAYLKKLVAGRIPVLGICLGAQLIAKSQGAAITKSKIKEIGWGTVRCLSDAERDPLFKDLPKVFDVFQWHEDTFSLPATARLLAEGEICGNQAFRIGQCAWALQFHFEVTPEIIGEWGSKYGFSNWRIRELMGLKDSFLAAREIIMNNFTSIIIEHNNKKFNV